MPASLTTSLHTCLTPSCTGKPGDDDDYEDDEDDYDKDEDNGDDNDANDYKCVRSYPKVPYFFIL